MQTIRPFRARRSAVALASGLAVVVSGLAWVATTPTPAAAGPGDGTLTVAVARDVSGDGVYDPIIDPPQAGIEVKVTDSAGNVANGVTNAAGEVVITAASALVGGRYRVETAVPAALSYLQPAPASASGAANAFRSVTTFVDVSGGAAETVRVGVWNPADYAPVDPDYVVAIQPSRSSPGTSRSLVRTNWAHRGDGNGGTTTPNTQNVTTLATKAQTGSVFGLAAERDERLFSAAYAKAFVPYGPGGSGAVYVTDLNSGLPNASLFVTIPNAGSTAHGNIAGGRDDDYYAAAGTEGLGGMAMSEDQSTLYVVNLNDRRLYEVDATGATGTITGSTAIADPGCVGGQWRPGAVTVRDGEVYVGGVCDGSVSGDRADLRAYVLRLDGGSFDTVLSQPLDFVRGAAENGGTAVSRQWNTWRTAWSRTGVDGLPVTPTAGSSYNIKYPTPFLTSLEFETDGSLFLGFRDRHADQIGSSGFEPGVTVDPVLVNAITGGDVNKACINPDGSYSWEGVNGCPDNTTSTPDGGQAAAVSEFFAGDWISLSGSTTTGNHQEVAQGGLAYAPRNGELGSIALDPTGLVGTGGIGFFDTATGQGPGGAPTTRGWLINTYPESFGKGNGLGDLDLLAGLAPVQIGNRVWFDADKDGVQDPDELPIPGATVTLLDSTGAVVATTTTNADGEYYFGGDGAAYQVVPGASYTVRFDVSTADTSGLPFSPPTSALSYTTSNSGGDDSLDSDPTPVSPGIAEVAITAPLAPGGVDHTIDAGVVLPPSVSVGDYVWVDSDKDGRQDDGEPGIPGVVLVLTGPDGQPVTDVFGNPVGPTTTDANGGYTFDNLPPLPAGQHYTVTIDQTAPSTQTALEPYVPTQSGQGDTAGDSSTWTAESSDLTDDGDRDPTLDFGFVPASVSVGDYVWVDSDKDGRQDDGEPGIPGVVLVLTGPDGQPVTDVDGNPVGPTTTDANGGYTFDNLPPLPAGQHYTVTIDQTAPSTQTALQPYQPTQAGQGDREGDSSTWSAESSDLTEDGDRDPTLDFGFVLAPPKQGQPTLTTATSDAKALVGAELHDSVTITGFTAGGTSTGSATLYGPFSSPSAAMCTADTRVGSVPFTPANGTVRTPSVTVTKPGYYTWVASITADQFNNATTHACGLAAETSLVHRPENKVRHIDTGFNGVDPGAAGRAALPGSPKRVKVPALGLNAKVTQVGLTDVRANVPKSRNLLGWLQTSARLDDAIGTTVVVGHVSDNRDRPGAFYDIKRLKAGKTVKVKGSDGKTYRYKVVTKKRFSRAKPLPESLFSMTGAPRVLLVTCTNKVTRPDGHFHYRDNLVVTLKPVKKK
ncbi:sortase [Nocardioides carbamazepini]|uniref:SdrD B-like domain-containing protein n=1 Tax=Nocardioides carbamazepini TaxID=2854259 RepID=UPI00214A5477|nr:SdrD B-like domain-containing protein [Nocardioides carbamazepini]MCR1783987.1 sortase [Nocardioides carbamazepini]